MRRGTDRLNRTLLVLLGLLLVGLGTAGLLRGGGALGGEAGDPIVSPWLRAEAHGRQALLLSLLAVAALVLIWLGLTWLLAQLPADRPVSDVALGRTEHASRVEVSAKAVTEALAADVRRIDGVSDASAKVVRQHPLTIDLHVSLEEGTDLRMASQAIADRPKRRLLQALDLPDVELRARLRLARPAARKVA
jgi:hypothetical protein